jgi:bifunctional DNA-binding transcriptional regulator/antitoxin component of YhaV-PrlF toxin-antitoxin module
MTRAKLTRRRGYTRLSSKRQVTLPLALVRELKLEAGDELRIEADGHGRVVLTKEPDRAAQRREAIAAVAGSVPGIWRAGDLDRLRDEWR